MDAVDIPGQKFEGHSATSRVRVHPRAGGRVCVRVCACVRGRARVCEYISQAKTGSKRRSKQCRCNKGMQQNAGSVAITTCPQDIESCGELRKVTKAKDSRVRNARVRNARVRNARVRNARA